MSWLIDFAVAAWSLTTAMAPWLLLGFALAGVCGRFVPREMIERHIAGNDLRSVIKAVVMGIPLPLCSCGVIPVAASLRAKGASRGAVAAFTAATPQTGVDSLAATYSLMGWIFTLGRLVADLIAGIAAGVLINWFAPDKNPPGQSASSGESCCSGAPKSCCSSQPPEDPDKTTGNNWRSWWHEGFVKMPADIGRYLVLGIVVGALITVIIPPDTLKDQLGHPLLSYVAITVVAVPLYVCATGSIPLAFAMMQVGVSPGAAIVFLVAGPATNTATFITLIKLIGRRATVIYLLTLIAAAWGVGLVFDYAISPQALHHSHEHHHAGGPSLWSHLSGIALVLILARAMPGVRRSLPSEE